MVAQNFEVDQLKNDELCEGKYHRSLAGDPRLRMAGGRGGVGLKLCRKSREGDKAERRDASRRRRRWEFWRGSFRAGSLAPTLGPIDSVSISAHPPLLDLRLLDSRASSVADGTTTTPARSPPQPALASPSPMVLNDRTACLPSGTSTAACR